MRRVRSVFCFDLARVFLQGSTMPPLHPKLFFGIVIIVGRGHYASASTYARHFVRVPPCHPYTKFLGLSLWEWGIIRLLRLSQFISSGSHHATTTPCFLFFQWYRIEIARRHCASTQLGYFFRVPPCPYTLIFFYFSFCQQCGIQIARRHCASTQLWYFSRVPPCPPYTIEIFLFMVLLLVWDETTGGILLRLSQGISSGCHHAPTTKKLFLELSDGDGPLFTSTYLRYFFRVPPCPHYTLEFLIFHEG